MRRLAVSLVAALVVPVTYPAHAAAACGAVGVPTSTTYLPNITKTLGGPTGWVTPFIVQNVGSSPATLEVSFYRFSDGALVACRSVPGLLPGTSFADVPNDDPDLPDDSQFSVVVRSFGSEVVAVVNEQQGNGIRAEALSYVGLSRGSTVVALPYVAKAASGWTTTIVVQNLGAVTASMSLTLTDSRGTRTATLTRIIESGRSQFIDPTVETALSAGTEYSGTATSGQPIAIVVNAHNDAPTVAQPMGFSYNGIPPAIGAQYLPYIARSTDGGRTTRVVVQNVGSSDSTPTLAFRSASGQQTLVRAPAAIRPGRSWALDPRFDGDGTTACPSAGSSTCVGVGEHGLVVSGGTFAVLGISTSPATAMGMTAMPPGTSRLYLPNITRTLGGSRGWTTPIVLQSTGATSAILRWYRFADGTLAVTQYVPDLATGAALRIDPREVTGLADATQYAVVVDASGGAVAAVLELNDLGGDGAMTYEGFPASATSGVVPSPASISIAPASASAGVGSRQAFTATVKDASGNPMIGVPLTWSVSPSTLGRVDANGVFTGSTSSGSGTVMASFGAISSTAAIAVVSHFARNAGWTFAGFEGLDYEQSRSSIPDVQIAVGPSHVVEATNYYLGIFDKSGKLLSTRSQSSLFGEPSVDLIDNHLMYDGGHFYLVGFSGFTGPGTLLVAVSKTADPTGAWQAWRFASSKHFDYPHIGISHDKLAVIITARPTEGSVRDLGYELHVLSRSDLDAGLTDPKRQVLQVATYLTPAHMLTSSDDLFLSESSKLWTLRGSPGATLTLTTQDVPGAFWRTGTTLAEQPGRLALWTGGGGRPVWANGVFWYTNVAACTPAGDTTSRNCARLYAVTTSGRPTLVESLDLGTAGSTYYLPVVQVDGAGNLVVFASRSSSAEPSSLYYWIRRADDPEKIVRGPFLVKAGNGAWRCDSCAISADDDRNRWGDFYGAALDPADLSMWFAGQYAKVTKAPSWCSTCTKDNDWGTYIARVDIEK